MSIGSWDPSTAESTKAFHIDKALLKRFIDICEHDQLDQLSQQLSAQELQIQSSLMQQDKASWLRAADTFNDNDIIQLMRFFTIAESLPGWEAGEKSPVIWLGKILKKRGTGIPTELSLWIKANSNNKFLPHGPL